MKIIKQVVYKDVAGQQKRYTNYILHLEINGKTYKVPFHPSTFGKAWTDPQVRAYFTLLDLVSELDIQNKDKE